MISEIVLDGLRTLGVEPDARAALRFEMYARLLTETNRVMNLTAITEEDEIARLHFLDCAALLTLPEPPHGAVVDVGSGAGFPGLPLKILRPELETTLLDSQKKRVGFLADTCAALGFPDVKCLHARAEESTGLRGKYDFALSRAVARLNLLCELCLPLVRVGGAFLAMKGPEPRSEIDEAARAVSILGGQLGKTFYYDVPGTDVRHSVVVVKKVAPTPEKYPRRFAKIQKQPL